MKFYIFANYYSNKPRTLSKVFERLAELIGEKEESMIRLLTNLTSSRLTNIGREASRYFIFINFHFIQIILSNSEYNELTGYRDSLKLTDSEIRQMIDFIKQQGGLSV